MEVLYVSGRDPLGRPIVVFVASRLPARKIDMDEFLMYAIHRLDPVVRGEYVLVYVESEVSSANRPAFAWLRRAYQLLNRPYKKHIQKLYMIHPSTATRLVMRLFRPFVSDKFWRKLVQVDDVASVHHYLSPDELRLPASCYVTAMRKGQRCQVWGTSLLLASRQQPHASTLPACIWGCLNALLNHHVLQSEGLLRVSGGEQQIRSLRERCEQWPAGEMGAEKSIDWSKEDPHCVSGLLKSFLRECRFGNGGGGGGGGGVVPSSARAALQSAHRRQQDDAFVDETIVALQASFNSNINNINNNNNNNPNADLNASFDCWRTLLCSVMHLMVKVSEHSAHNKMTPHNLAVCMAPHLLPVPQGAGPAQALQETAFSTALATRLVQNWTKITQKQPLFRVQLP